MNRSTISEAWWLGLRTFCAVLVTVGGVVGLLMGAATVWPAGP